ncbi:NADPH-dependent F420 reductase [Nonomuraea angiospora]|uniref:NADPH-dependent F420 reductase n=1 Tax=Nonomuraea angiospora TaxID=46172 RepID=UPI0029AB8FB8|nr:NAD(P)-binding domain-containing protein [Nonomuraea angiospora]MDX3102632.1 NAD(P)-binding domain-containing protein [Nonomuraea angiospora]
MTQTLGLIGSGMIGGTVARLAVAAGIDVVLSNSRGPESLADLVAELGEHASAATPAEAARAGDLVVATIPLHAYDRLPAADLAGKTVVDTMNYYPDRDGDLPELSGGALTSTALVQRHLAGAPDRSALPVAGDDEGAKAQVARLLDALGYDAVDVGTIADSWRVQPGTPVYVQPYFPSQLPEGLDLDESLRWFVDTPGVPVPADQVRKLADQAVL